MNLVVAFFFFFFFFFIIIIILTLLQAMGNVALDIKVHHLRTNSGHPHRR